MIEKELQSYIKDLETALFLTSRDKVSWQVIEQIVNNNISLDFKQRLLNNTNKLVIQNNLSLKTDLEKILNTTF
ncbi:hypothetical protein [Capnocytophaga gingivalis]|jgi:hypothetical protein|uniref:hypothetical protein n=1 Tax=Capnocytophaga gingivalis TaxID=1017 RepID=UPI0023538AE1|nr:hypothetical protein [Capnocytophaga gingivalis]